MAVIAITDPHLTIEGTDMSDMARQVAITVEVGENDINSFGTDWEKVLGGLKSWEFTVTFNQDFAAAQVDATLWPLLGRNDVTIAVRPTSAVKSATNPEYTGDVFVSGYTPVDAEAGGVIQPQLTWQGNGALSRSVS